MTVDCPQRVGGIELQEVADGYVALDPRNERVHYLNHTATMVLELCDGERGIEDIAGALQSAFDLGEPPREDVRECVGVLRSERLLH